MKECLEVVGLMELYIEQLDQNSLKHAIKSQNEPDVRCPTGEARITPGFKLPASHVIHTVGPIYDSHKDPKASLTSAYKNCLSVAKENNIEYIAFTAISCGVYGYPFEEAATIAISTVKNFADGIKEVHFVLFSDQLYNVWLNKAKELLQASMHQSSQN
ncbi:hypothetical protein ES332_A10G213200v1 [Gossypium tomentosum]|uniref:Macro domain-containing protein n=1 Tax=Gossypium tomentosum TaxID=34277 RepID=A0A5D2NSY2_GOSTO|nr:hypothetical protein ES332_A10G213200v1 [Gossypium tomentosum]